MKANFIQSQNNSYNHQDIEQKWRGVWDKLQLDVTDIHGGKPYYNLMMFPYPSAEGLHVGNMYAFTGSDIYGRYMRMQGYDVFEPIGLDGFGIHSENYALKVGRHPKDHAAITEKHFYDQLRTIGAMFDWKRTLTTYDPLYYRWTQWLFVQMFKHGLAYRGKASVNWCPGCKTVLADEQVVTKKPGTQTCERCGNKVEKRQLEQWFFRITAYAEKLLKNLPELKWSEKVKTAQSKWIGKKEGITITYPVVDEQGNQLRTLSCFTTRPDTNFGATFVVIASEHPLIAKIENGELRIENEKIQEITNYVRKSKQKSEQERISEGRKKTGVFTGLYCVNQLNNNKLPIYISDFVLTGFGTGAVVGVPGHDKRDFEFAKIFDLPIIRVVTGKDKDDSAIKKAEQVQEDEGIMINSGFLNGLDIGEATKKMMDYLEEKGWGKRTVTYHLRDWLISRQRYWGPPIPMIYCEHCGWLPVPEDQLPVLLPDIKDYKPGDDGVAPLAKHKEFYEVACPKCGKTARRETDVSDTFLDSAWYFLKYPSPASNLPWNLEITRRWLPVDMYTGGAEHSVLHLMYSRFVTMALHDWELLDFEEPFTNFFAHGLVIKDGAKMSKSKGNVVNPDEYIANYGVDALRMYLMFMGPFDQGGDFRDTAMEGMSRWVGRVWRLISESAIRQRADSSDAIIRFLHKTIAKVSDDLPKRRYNTAIAAMMEFTNFVADQKETLGIIQAKEFVKILAPFAPYLTEELWQILHGRKKMENKKESVHFQIWPVFDKTLVRDTTIQFVIQVNGKVLEVIPVSVKESQNQKAMEILAKASKKLGPLIDRGVTKIIFVTGKLINFVIR